MSSTYGGNPVSSAAVTAVLEIFENENLTENSAKMGEYIKERLLKIAEKCPYLGDVRGMGLVMGLEIVSDKTTKEPAPKLIRQIIDKCAQNGLLVGSVGMYGNVIRVAPPLVIKKDEADESLAIMEKVLMSLEL
jgi:4-aminobutyrate aminotransferase-like enzyme